MQYSIDILTLCILYWQLSKHLELLKKPRPSCIQLKVSLAHNRHPSPTNTAYFQNTSSVHKHHQCSFLIHSTGLFALKNIKFSYFPPPAPCFSFFHFLGATTTNMIANNFMFQFLLKSVLFDITKV